MSAVPQLLPFRGEGIPSTLKAHPRWAPWAAEWNEKRGKYDKIPRRANDPEVGLSTAKPDLWSTYEAAQAAYRRQVSMLAGIGYCMTGLHGIVAVDLDNCIENGRPVPWAAKVIERLGRYTERSPSGNGYRVMGLGSIPFDWTNHRVGIEVYGGHEPRFVTITGEHLAGSPEDLRDLDPVVLEDLARDYGSGRKRAVVIDLAAPDLLDELVLPDLETLKLPDKVKRFLATGEVGGGDRSAVLHATGVALYALGLEDATVFSLLAANEHAMAVALDHRRQDIDRAKLYLWNEHCVKAKGKASSAVATPDEFDLVVLEPDGQRLPPPAYSRDRYGRIQAVINNVAMAVRRPDVCGIDLRFDKFRDEIMYSLAGRGQWRAFADADYARLRITLEKRGFKPIGRELIRDVVLLVASEHCFDSAIEWLTPMAWDGTPRVDKFLHLYLGAPDTEYTRAVSRYLWTALAGRVMQPGVKADMVPILVGEQGAGKSRAAAAIAPGTEFFAEVSLHDKDDDLSRMMRGRLVAEIGELRGLHTKELESIKAFITRTHENWIPKYREFATQFPRRLVFIGTTNKDEFLADETGNRRWLPVRVSRVDVAAIERDRDQLWAEGRELFTTGGVQYREVEQLSATAHDEHTITDTWVDAIQRWLAEPDTLTGDVPAMRGFLRLADVLKGALRFEERQIGRREEMRAGAVLRGMGYSRKKVRDGTKVLWAFVPPEGAADGG